MTDQFTVQELLIRLFPYLVCLVFGLVVGSCVNVIAYRVPLRKSIVHPGSFCPQCGFILPWFDNVPVLSWLNLRARCRSCSTLISPRYPLIESTLALLYMAMFAQKYAQETGSLTPGTLQTIFPSGTYFELFIGALFIAVMVILALIDIDFRLLPNVITLPAIPVFLVLNLLLCIPPFRDPTVTAYGGFGIFLSSLIGMIALPVGFIVLDFVSMLVFHKPGFGGGDIKLVALIGAALGWERGVLAIFIGIFAGGAVAIIRLLTRNLIWGRKSYMAFGPFLCGGAIISMIFGMDIVRSYLQNLGQQDPLIIASLIPGW